jgi:hypothetical protein
MAVLAAALASLVVTFTAPGHSPRIGTSETVGPKWYYVVKVTQAGRPVPARLTLQIVDPLGTAHPVQVAMSAAPITSYPIRGTYRDFLIFPPASRGIPLTIRATIVSGAARRVLTYVVTPRR